MLVLTRKQNESLIINGEIKCTILAVKGGQVRIGIEAPKDVPIHREELLLSQNDLAELEANLNKAETVLSTNDTTLPLTHFNQQ